MKEYEELYTVNEVAVILGLSTRTVRKYLRENILVGRRVGGQWRFVKDDIDKLLKRREEKESKPSETNDLQDNAGSQDISSALVDEKYSELNEFLFSEQRLPEGTVRICSVVDFYCSNRVDAEKKAGSLRAIVTGMNADISFTYDYLRAQRKVRFIITGEARYVNQITSLI